MMVGGGGGSLHCPTTYASESTLERGIRKSLSWQLE